MFFKITITLNMRGVCPCLPPKLHIDILVCLHFQLAIITPLLKWNNVICTTGQGCNIVLALLLILFPIPNKFEENYYYPKTTRMYTWSNETQKLPFLTHNFETNPYARDIYRCSWNKKELFVILHLNFITCKMLFEWKSTMTEHLRMA